MKAKIQRSMLLVLFVTILIFYGLLYTGYVSEEPDAAKRRSESGGQVYPDCCRYFGTKRI